MSAGRWLAFNLVGAGGFVIQLAAVWVLTAGLGVHAAAASVAAVEIAILHNFAWHRRWTWADRSAAGAAAQLLRIHLGSGAVSLAGTAIAVPALTGPLGLAPVMANILTMAGGSAMNFAINDRFVFGECVR